MSKPYGEQGDTIVRIMMRIYSFAMVILPFAFRREYGNNIIALATQACADAYKHGALRLAKILFLIFLDLFTVAISEWSDIIGWSIREGIYKMCLPLNMGLWKGLSFILISFLLELGTLVFWFVFAVVVCGLSSNDIQESVTVVSWFVVILAIILVIKALAMIAVILVRNTIIFSQILSWLLGNHELQLVSSPERTVTRVRTIFAKEEGQDLVEYALILVLIAAVAIPVLTVRDNKMNTMLTEISSILK